MKFSYKRPPVCTSIHEADGFYQIFKGPFFHPLQGQFHLGITVSRINSPAVLFFDLDKV
jgi:hypothetical protein